MQPCGTRSRCSRSKRLRDRRLNQLAAELAASCVGIDRAGDDTGRQSGVSSIHRFAPQPLRRSRPLVSSSTDRRLVLASHLLIRVPSGLRPTKRCVTTSALSRKEIAIVGTPIRRRVRYSHSERPRRLVTPTSAPAGRAPSPAIPLRGRVPRRRAVTSHRAFAGCRAHACARSLRRR
jgi:hypothetical protein